MTKLEDGNSVMMTDLCIMGLHNSCKGLGGFKIMNCICKCHKGERA